LVELAFRSLLRCRIYFLLFFLLKFSSFMSNKENRCQFHQRFMQSFSLIDPESVKKIDNLTATFTHLGSVSIKAANKMLMKLSPDISLNGSIQILWLNSRWKVNSRLSFVALIQKTHLINPFFRYKKNIQFLFFWVKPL